MGKQKELQPTKELVDIFDECLALEKCRDACIRLVFRTRSAIQYATKAVKLNKKFWKLSLELYPQMKEGGWAYNGNDNVYFKDD